ncbi:Uncharacterised protein g5519 [Pycnogonum litorale]
MYSHHAEEINVLTAIFDDRLLIDDVHRQDSLKLKIIIRVHHEAENVLVYNDIRRAEELDHPLVNIILPVELLPPTVLEVILHPRYPDCEPPRISISCDWLTFEDMDAVRQELQRYFRKGEPIVYDWILWIQDEMLEWLLGKTGRIIDVDGLQSDRLIELAKLSKRECGICFDAKSVDGFLEIPKCRHRFCTECLVSFCNVHVTDGTVDELKCPDEDCAMELPQVIFKDVLSEELMLRWDQMCLSKQIDRMKGVKYCPKCNLPSAGNSGQPSFCCYCFFTYCCKCGKDYHPGEDCFRAKETSEENSDDDDYIKNEVAIRRLTKPCPHCKVPIEKNFGCSHIICINCRQSMCWDCQSPWRSCWCNRVVMQTDHEAAHYQFVSEMLHKRRKDR